MLAGRWYSPAWRSRVVTNTTNGKSTQTMGFVVLSKIRYDLLQDSCSSEQFFKSP